MDETLEVNGKEVSFFLKFKKVLLVYKTYVSMDELLKNDLLKIYKKFLDKIFE